MEKYTTKNTKATKKPSAQTEARPVAWSDITGRARVFSNVVERKKATFCTYNVTVSKKNEDGTYVNMSIKTKFAKDCDPAFDAELFFDIEIKKAFLTVDEYTRKDGTTGKSLVLVIMDYTMIEDE